jgi:hypothetical protein
VKQPDEEPGNGGEKMLNTDHLERCLLTLEASLDRLRHCEPGSLDYDIYRNAAVKGFELSLETSGKLLRKALKEFFATPREVDRLSFKDIFRYGAKHGFLSDREVERWFRYRDNSTAHDYGEAFAEETLVLMSAFVDDARHLRETLNERN